MKICHTKIKRLFCMNPHHLSTTMAPPGFQNQGALSSNYLGNTRQVGVNELLLVMNKMKTSNESRLTQLENNQIAFGMHIKSLENIQATMGTCMKIIEHNQANIGTCMKNMETNQANLGASLKNLESQMGQLAQYLRENPPKSFPSDTEKNPKQCMAITLRSGKEIEELKKNLNEEEQFEK